MKNAYIDSFQIHSSSERIHFYLRTPVRGLGHPEVRISKYNKSGESGGYVSNTFYGMRNIPLQGYFSGDTLIEYNANRRALEAILLMEKDSLFQPIAKQFKFETDDGLQLQADVYIDGSPIFDITNLKNGRFFIKLVSPDYGLESQILKSETLSIPSGGGALYPVIYPVEYEAATGGSQTLNNLGTAESFPVVTLTGPLTNPFIQNQTTDSTVSLDLVISSGSTVVIDMKAGSVILDGTIDKASAVENGSKFWSLQPGNNIVNFGSDDSSDIGEAQINYRDTYIGV